MGYIPHGMRLTPYFHLAAPIAFPGSSHRPSAVTFRIDLRVFRHAFCVEPRSVRRYRTPRFSTSRSPLRGPLSCHASLTLGRNRGFPPRCPPFSPSRSRVQISFIRAKQDPVRRSARKTRSLEITAPKAPKTLRRLPGTSRVEKFQCAATTASLTPRSKIGQVAQIFPLIEVKSPR